MELQNYTREQMAETVKRVFTEVTDLFKRKNGSYGRDNDAFGNFRQATARIRNSQEANEVFDTLMIYVEKHLYALYQNKLDDNEFEEQTMDPLQGKIKDSKSMVQQLSKENKELKAKMKRMANSQNFYRLYYCKVTISPSLKRRKS